MPKTKPSIVFILADDLGYGDLGCYGAMPHHVATPNIDRLATSGVRFTDAHSPSSVCTPSRYNLLTGRYCWRTWAKTGCIWANDPCVIEADRPTLASVLRNGGYETGMVGKWHLGFGSPDDADWDRYRGPNFNRPLTHGPLTSGFDSFFGIPAVGQFPHFYIYNDMVADIESGDPVRMVPDPRPEYLVEYLDRPRTSNPQILTQGGASTAYLSEELAIDLTREAVAFIDKPHDRPYFLYFAHRNVHEPLTPHPRFAGTSSIGDYGDFIHELDWSVGEILAALDRNGATDDTLVIFASDNGATEHHRPVEFVSHNGHRSNGISRGAKTEVYEGGHRIPFLASWPGRLPAGMTCSHLIALTDMLPTCAEIAGVPAPAGAAPDGVSCARSFFDPGAGSPARDTVIHDSAIRVTYAVRHNQWKLILGQDGGGLGTVSVPAGASKRIPGQLFNLEEDPTEGHNVYLEHTDIVNELTDRYLTIRDCETGA